MVKPYHRVPRPVSEASVVRIELGLERPRVLHEDKILDDHQLRSQTALRGKVIGLSKSPFLHHTASI